MITFACAQENSNYIRPNYLKKGDTVAIVAPSGVVVSKKNLVKKAITVLQEWGLKVQVGSYVFAQDHHFAGTDAQRLRDFQQAINNPNIKAIWCARGGYGAMRIIDEIDFSALQKHPKWLVGFSDITAFHNQFHNEGIQSIHAMMCTGVNNTDLQPDEVILNLESLKKALFGKELSYKIASSKYNKKGTAKGVLVGGNLSLLQATLQSKSSINTKGKILFIEEVGEYKYSIDRMLYSLKRAGYFKDIKGLIIGGMTSIKKNNPSFGKTIEELILEVVAPYNFPVLFDFPAGHGDANRALILGRSCTLTVAPKESTLIFN